MTIPDVQVGHKEEAEDEADDAGARVDEEGARVADVLHEVRERLGHDEGAGEREAGDDLLAHAGQPRRQQPFRDHPQQGAVPDVA